MHDYLSPDPLSLLHVYHLMHYDTTTSEIEYFTNTFFRPYCISLTSDGKWRNGGFWFWFLDLAGLNKCPWWCGVYQSNCDLLQFIVLAYTNILFGHLPCFISIFSAWLSMFVSMSHLLCPMVFRERSCFISSYGIITGTH